MKMKHFLIFITVEGCSEESNVHYSHLVIAKDEETAKTKFNLHCENGKYHYTPNWNELGIMEIKPIR